MPIDDDLRNRLQVVVANARLPIDPRCRVLLDTLIEVGVQRVQDEAVEGSFDPARIDDAVEHLRRLLDDTTQQSRILRFDALHEPTLVSALARLHPLWPFG